MEVQTTSTLQRFGLPSTADVGDASRTNTLWLKHLLVTRPLFSVVDVWDRSSVSCPSCAFGGLASRTGITREHLHAHSRSSYDGNLDRGT